MALHPNKWAQTFEMRFEVLMEMTSEIRNRFQWDSGTYVPDDITSRHRRQEPCNICHKENHSAHFKLLLSKNFLQSKFCGRFSFFLSELHVQHKVLDLTIQTILRECKCKVHHCILFLIQLIDNISRLDWNVNKLGNVQIT